MPAVGHGPNRSPAFQRHVQSKTVKTTRPSCGLHPEPHIYMTILPHVRWVDGSPIHPILHGGMVYKVPLMLILSLGVDASIAAAPASRAATQDLAPRKRLHRVRVLAARGRCCLLLSLTEIALTPKCSNCIPKLGITKAGCPACERGGFHGHAVVSGQNWQRMAA